MAKQTVAQVAPSFHDFDVKLNELDQLFSQGMQIKHELTVMIRAKFNAALTNQLPYGNL